MAIFKKVKPGGLSGVAPKPEHTVLLVDDEPDNLNVLSSILGKRYNILQAGDGQEALDIVNRLPPGQVTLVVSDQRMPRLTGVQLCEQLCTISPDTMRIIVTGYIDIDAIVDSVNRARIYKFVIKPFDRHDFELTVQRAIEAWEARHEHDCHVSQLKTDLDSKTRELAECREKLQLAEARLQQLGQALP